jgi:hypothetical protein
MLIAGTIIWVIVGAFAFIMGSMFTMDEEIHRGEPFENLYDSWGATRFYTLWFICLLLLAAVWPIALLTLWITALIKGW